MWKSLLNYEQKINNRRIYTKIKNNDQNINNELKIITKYD